ncbi:MAG: alanine racemase [Ignavibacteriae bacterium]|nr:alanine racemase [Ignavibacteria bacterium]MBI3364023.1 alanine racemase [Ignavibacteriota bacterium]
MRLTRVEINLNALQFNVSEIRKRVGPKVKIMGIVKANAYGHGIVGVAHALTRFGVDYLGVGFLEEGVQLRNHGISAPILVLGGVVGSQIHQFLSYDLDITVASIEIAELIDTEALVNSGKRARVHLKIDTGMERIGVHAENAGPFIERVCGLKNIDVVGIYSHLATADEHDKSFAEEQMQRFTTVLDCIRRKGIAIPFQHIANSGAILDLPQSYYSMVRPGIMLYGIYPSDTTSESIPLHPVLTLRSKVAFIKEVPAGVSISYGRQYTTTRRTKIATVPIGYGDGYGRMLTNQIDVLIRGNRYPVVGTICMDQIMVDLGPDSNVHVGVDVTLIGREGNETITAWEISKKLGTIPYEVLTNIAARVPRVTTEES